MEFDFTEKQFKARDRARAFAVKQVKPRLAEFAETRTLPAAIGRQLSELKLWAALVSEEEGGAGLDPVGYALTLMELAKVWGSLAAVLLAHNSFFCAPLLKYADPEQKKQYLRTCLAGTETGCLAVHEAEAGLDFSRFQTHAVRRKDTQSLAGRKGPVLNAETAAYALTAGYDEQTGSREIGLWIVPRKHFKIEPVRPEWGFPAAGLAEILFEDIALPANALLGLPGQGRQQLKELEQNSRVTVAALAIGIGRAMLAESRDFASDRTQFGKPLAASQAVQWKWADLATDLEAADLLTLRAAWFMDQGKPFEKEAAMAVQFALQSVLKAGRESLAILAVHGYPLKNRMASLIQDAQGCQLFHIHDETLTSIIAKNL